jgi:hypothetical protein
VGEKLIDGRVSISVSVSNLMKLKKLMVDKSLSSHNSAVSYLLGYFEEATKEGDLK